MADSSLDDFFAKKDRNKKKSKQKSTPTEYISQPEAVSRKTKIKTEKEKQSTIYVVGIPPNECLNMEVDRIHIRHCMLYEFRKGSNATAATKELCTTLGEDVVDVRTVQRWFSKFRTGNFNLEDEPHTGRHSNFCDDILRALLLEDQYLSVRDIAEKMGFDHTTVSRHINKLGYVEKFERWVLLKNERNS